LRFNGAFARVRAVERTLKGALSFSVGKTLLLIRSKLVPTQAHKTSVSSPYAERDTPRLVPELPMNSAPKRLRNRRGQSIAQP